MANPRQVRNSASGSEQTDIDDPGPVIRTGRSVRLVPADQRYADFLYSLAIDETVGFRWILTGQVPRREVFEQQLWNGVLSQFVVCRKDSDGPIGVVLAYNADLNNGYAYAASAVISEAVGSGVGIEAVDLFVDYLFRCFNLRKIYFEVPEYNLPEIQSLIGGLFHQECVLREHTYYAGRHWNRYILALYRQDYDNIASGIALGGRRRRMAR